MEQISSGHFGCRAINFFFVSFVRLEATEVIINPLGCHFGFKSAENTYRFPFALRWLLRCCCITDPLLSTNAKLRRVSSRGGRKERKKHWTETNGIKNYRWTSSFRGEPKNVKRNNNNKKMDSDSELVLLGVYLGGCFFFFFFWFISTDCGVFLMDLCYFIYYYYLVDSEMVMRRRVSFFFLVLSFISRHSEAGNRSKCTHCTPRGEHNRLMGFEMGVETWDSGWWIYAVLPDRS